MKTNPVRVAVAQYEIERLATWHAYEDKTVRLVEDAKDHDAHLLALSEYAGLELAGWSDTTLPQQFEHIQTLLPQYLQLFAALAQQYGIFIQPGTLPVKESDGMFRNRAFLFSPSGDYAFQDKLYLTPFELQTNLLVPGNELTLFDTKLGKLGINICYDTEFPHLAAHLAASGVKLILVPSCTEKFSGLTRVAIASQARAIENQCYVAQSCLVGKATWCDFIDINTGLSSIFCPADSGFPENGILTQAQLNTPMLIYSDLNWEKLSHVRQNGEMHNFNDMQKNATAILNSMQTIKLNP